MSTRTSFFQSLRGKTRTGILTEGVALIGVAFAGFMLISFALDRTLRLEVGYRAVLLLLFVVGFVRLLYVRLMTPLQVDLTDEELALAVERGETDLRQALISAVQFEHDLERGGGPESAELKQVVVADVQRRLPHLHGSRALDGARIRRYAGMLTGALVVVLGWSWLDPGALGLWARRNLLLSAEEWPRYTRLNFVMVVEDGAIRHAENNDLTVEVEAAGVIPEQVFLNYKFLGGIRGKDLMVMTGEEAQELPGSRRFLTTLPAVIEGADIWATGGDGLSETLRIQLIKRPLLTDFKVVLHYPAYMKRDPVAVPDTEGELQVPIGSKLAVTAQSTKDLRRAFLAFGRDNKTPVALGEEQRKMSGEFHPKLSGVLALDVEDRDGLGALKPPKLFLRVVPDNVPSVDFKSQGIGSMVTHKARIPGTLKVRDDYGLTKVSAHMRLTAGPEGKQIKEQDAKWEPITVSGLRKLKEDASETEYIEPVVLDLLVDLNKNQATPTAPDNRVQPDHLLALRFKGQDNFGPDAPHVGQSDVLTFRVVTESKLMEDITRRQIEQRRELVQILNKEIAYKAEIEEMPSPSSSHPKAHLAKLRFLALARAQRTLATRVNGVAARYRQILDELLNNRVVKPGVVSDQRAVIQRPLETLGAEDFPSTANMVAEYAHNGDEEIRRLAVDSYESIIAILKSVLERMRRLESLAGILERLREVRKTEDEIARIVKKTLEEQARQIHGPAKKNNDPKKPEKSNKPVKKPDNGRDSKESEGGDSKESSPPSRENRNQKPAPASGNQPSRRGR
ncbi:MAG: hypothetical protein ACYS5W_11275 [Planctomycetota bacterium]|jgi:hypothetical protein